MSVELRKDWICAGCGMRCYKAGGEEFPRPEGWQGDRCTTCKAEASATATRALSREESRAAVRDRIENGPPRQDRDIAAELGVATAKVRAIRKGVGRPVPHAECAVCERVSASAGAIGVHQKATGHVGLNWIDPPQER